MAKWQDGIAHKPLLVFSLVNVTSTTWQNILPYTHKKGERPPIRMVSQRNPMHNNTLSVLWVLFLWSKQAYSLVANQLIARFRSAMERREQDHADVQCVL